MFRESLIIRKDTQIVYTIDYENSVELVRFVKRNDIYKIFP